jgi:hypothetical protein
MDFYLGELQAWLTMGVVFVLNLLWFGLNCAFKRLGRVLQVTRRVLADQMTFIFLFALFLELIPVLEIRTAAFLDGERSRRIVYFLCFRAIFVGVFLNLSLMLVNRILYSLTRGGSEK